VTLILLVGAVLADLKAKQLLWGDTPPEERSRSPR
jgi:hypothetical protein